VGGRGDSAGARLTDPAVAHRDTVAVERFFRRLLDVPSGAPAWPRQPSTLAQPFGPANRGCTSAGVRPAARQRVDGEGVVPEVCGA
jgi:hypothetical protein